MKEEKNVTVKVSVNEETGKVSAKISKDIVSQIPRPGESLHVIRPYPADDDDEVNGKIKTDAILGWSYNEQMIRSVAITEDNDKVIINGDHFIPLTSDMRLNTEKIKIFTKEDDAVKEYTELMNASINEARRRKEKYTAIQGFLENSLEKNFH